VIEGLAAPAIRKSRQLPKKPTVAYELHEIEVIAFGYRDADRFIP